MGKRILFAFALIVMSLGLCAQEDLSRLSTPGASKSSGRDVRHECVPTWMFQFTYAYQFPDGDTKVLYDNNHSIGGSVFYKTGKNWIYGLNGNFISGNKVNISRTELFGEILDLNGEIITGDGIYGSYALYERGGHIQLTAGKIFAFKKPNPNSGILLQGGLGYLFNRLRTEFGSYASPPAALNGDYLYGYDKQRGGFAMNLQVGYFYMSSTRVLNFSVTLEVTQAFTKNQRQWDFKTGETSNAVYNDRYYGIRVAIYIPTYKRAPADYYYY